MTANAHWHLICYGWIKQRRNFYCQFTIFLNAGNLLPLLSTTFAISFCTRCISICENLSARLEHLLRMISIHPWQNPYCERVIGSIRRDCLNYIIVLNEKHLKGILPDYFEYYHSDRTRLGLSSVNHKSSLKWYSDRPSTCWRASPSL